MLNDLAEAMKALDGKKCVTSGCTVWLCWSKLRKGAGVDRSVMTNEGSREKFNFRGVCDFSGSW